MGDADREAEMIKSSMYSHVPVFEKDTYSSGANGGTSNRTAASSPEMDDGPSQRDHLMRRGFASGRSLGNRDAITFNKRENTSTVGGFGVGKSFGNRGFSNNEFEEADRSAFWRDSEYEQDEGTQHTGGLFGSGRPALSGAGLGGTYQSRGSGGSRRGPEVTYIPPPAPEDEESIFAHYQPGRNFDKYHSILVDVSGPNAPPPILTFKEANLCRTLNDNIAKAGYTKLTPVQKDSIPIILAGRDLVACAQTESGKTDTYSSGANGGTSNRTAASSPEMDDGPSQRDHLMRRGFASGRSLGNRDAGMFNKRENTSTMGGFEVGKSFGNRGFSNNEFEEADRSAFWRGHGGTYQSRGSGGSRRGPEVTYIPPPPPEDEESIFAHYQPGRNFDKYHSILVDVSGPNAPPPILTFKEANLCRTLNDNIAKAGYTKLTPVQKDSIPIILAGRDLVACAQTESGKTDTYSSGANGGTSNRTAASSPEMDDGPSQRDHFMQRGFASERSLGNRDAGTFNKRENTSTVGGFGVGKSFGNRGFSNNEFEEANHSAFWRGHGGTYQSRGSGGSRRGPKVTDIPPPPPEDEESIFAHYQPGRNFDKYHSILVDVSGPNAPPPILTFKEANLCQTLNDNIAKAGYTKLTPVQKYSIPIILAGRDLIACAQTGSGKTVAFLLPILAHMMSAGITASRSKELQEPECIIVAPTRELIRQICSEAKKFSFGTRVRAVAVYGGTQFGHSVRQIVQGCNILCSTPGRLVHIIGKEKIGLGQVRYLVLDEADRMLAMGFGPEMEKLISCPGMPPKEQRQTIMFSATFPEEMQRLAWKSLKRNYLFVVVGQVGGACRDVQQIILPVSKYSKREKLVGILLTTGDERTVVFVGTKKRADFIATFLCQVKISTTSIHGDRQQREREQSLEDFRCGRCPVLVATSVVGRGLDIENVQHVINFDLPSTIEEYVHRIGRTGRCGKTGRAISFFDPESDNHLAQPLVKVLSDAQQDVPAWLEEIACSTRSGSGPSGSTRGNVFASVDTRKNYQGKRLSTQQGFLHYNLPIQEVASHGIKAETAFKFVAQF